MRGESFLLSHGAGQLAQTETAASHDAATVQPERRSEVRKTTAIHAFASDTGNKYNVKCIIRNVSPSGCKIVSNGMDDLPGLIYLLPEKFDKPILGRIVWRKRNMGGVRFLSQSEEEECLFVAPLEHYHDDAGGPVRERAALYSCEPPMGFRDRFQIFAGRRERKVHSGQTPGAKTAPRRNALGNAVARMAHELRVLLSAFLAALGFGASRRGGTGAQANAAETRIAASPHDIVALLRQCIDESASLAVKYGIRFHLNDTVGFAQVQVDAPAMKQAVCELLSNAAKVSPEDERVEVAAERRGRNIRIAVSDHGLGMPREEQERLLHQPVSAPSYHDGNGHESGQGLAMCRRIVEGHGARLQIDSSPGTGSVFFFDLPEMVSGQGSRTLAGE
jgi:anti-sigma regulatory factor (Ser/Thr protein kinase)